MIDPLKLSNVTIKNKQDNREYHVRQPLTEVLVALATKNPTWSFVGMVKYGDEIEKFKVYCEDQEIGELERAWSSRSGGKCVRVDSDELNHRILTKDPKKAIREAQRNFVVKTETMLIEKNLYKSNEVIRNTIYRKDERVRDRLTKLNPYIQSFAMMQHRDMFIQSLKDTNGATLVEEYETTLAEAKALRDIDAKRQDDRVAHIMLYKGKYVVKTVDNVKSYDDNTLPEEYRGKLGMLKLVENEQCISDTGCRVSDDLFMITL